MGIKKVSLGSNKNIRKEINLEVTKTHIAFFFIGLLFFVAVIHYIIILFFAPIQNLEFNCADGTTERVEYQKDFYCGVHYSELEGSISEKSYNNVVRQIEVGDLYGE